MNQIQKIGGVAAILHSAAYLIGIGLYLAVMSPIIDATPAEYVALLAGYRNIMVVWILIAYLVAGFCLVAVALAFYERMKDSSPALIQISTVLGFIWAALIIGSGNLMIHGFDQIAEIYATNPALAETVYMTLGIVENGIVSANELIGGVWVLLLSWAALQTGNLGRSLNYLGVGIGVMGILTLIPPIAELTQMIFGLSMIIWFAWAGVILLRSRSMPTT
jgi:hypothetical protein